MVNYNLQPKQTNTMENKIKNAKEWWYTFLIESDKQEVRLNVPYNDEGEPLDWNYLAEIYQDEIDDWMLNDREVEYQNWQYVCDINSEYECWESDGKSYRVPIEIIRNFNDAELINN